MSIENPSDLNGSKLRNTAKITVMEQPPPQPAPDDTPLSFEEALRELEEVVTTLETGNVPLEQAIARLRRGMVLAAQCDATLAGAEATLEQLITTDDGELVTERLSYDEDEDALEPA